MTFSRRLVPILVCIAALAPLSASAAKHRRAAPAPAADSGSAYKGAIIMDAATGKVLFEDHADEISPPASMTKLMTFAVICDKLADHTLTLSTPVNIAVSDYKMGGTQVYLDPKETFPVEELIYAMMIQSANDAAHALARAAAGSIEGFVDLMNAKARELGMTHTTFRSPHGLPPASRRIADGDLTTPRDFALLSRYLLLKTDVLKYTSIRMRKFGEGIRAPAKVVMMVNHDHLLEKVAGVDGLKTGFTNGAGFCLAATAERNHHRVIVVVMGSPSSKTRDFKVAEFLDHGFAAIPADSPPFQPAVSSVALAPAVTAAPLPPEEKNTTQAASPVITFPVPARK
ncbi:MAG TPA: D-alanyl-D-alanine carboxypeptidase family protein [Opitutus sp.]|nr:D-alanyl-D-alanine carboxypeptidase family protein [Opitutus sp.]